MGFFTKLEKEGCSEEVKCRDSEEELERMIVEVAAAVAVCCSDIGSRRISIEMRRRHLRIFVDGRGFSFSPAVLEKLMIAHMAELGGM